MSKRNSIAKSPSVAGNTLFNYFVKSPQSQLAKTPSGAATKEVTSSGSAAKTPKLKEKSVATPSTNSSKNASNKKIDFGSDSKKVKEQSSDDEEMTIQKKRRRIIMDSDSDRENESDNSQSNEKQPSTKREAPGSPAEAKKKKIKLDTAAVEVLSASKSFEDKLKSFKPTENADQSEIPEPLEEAAAIADEPTVWRHNKLPFLKPDKIKDIHGHKIGHPDYDPTTLYVPNDYLNDLTPGMRQWWELKSHNFDCIIFFKVGKFYELYHMDADVGVAELGFTYMKGEFAHSGFPEQSYDRMATSLVNKGFKVARIEQTETPDMMQERLKTMKKTTKFDKVVKREVCQVVNRGTQVFGQQVAVTNNYQPNFMLAIAENHTTNSNRFGICFIDTSLGRFHIGEFDDDTHCSRLLTLLSHYPPVLVLYERNGLSARSSQIFKTVLSNTLRENLLPDTQFWTAEKTLKTMAEKYYSNKSKVEWPELFKLMQDDQDHLGLTPSNGYRLALKSLGACIWYLSKCLVDQQIISMSSFRQYSPPDSLTIDELRGLEDAATKASTEKLNSFTHHMVLDSITLSNLKITSDENSLLSTLDHCCTKFGKRLLHQWVCGPSCDRQIITLRQTAIKKLLEAPELLASIRTILGTLPDLERQLAQIHTFGNASRSKDHPDGRAIFFEQNTYNKKKIQDFVSTLNGLTELTKIPNLMVNCESEYLLQLSQTADKGGFPDMVETLAFFKTGFNHEEALAAGVIAPGEGVDKEFDAIAAEIAEINDELQDYLKKQEKKFGCRIVYFGTDKKRFQLEIPESNAKRADSSYTLEGQKKGSKPVKRFHTEETRDFLKRMMHAEDQRNVVLKDLSRRMFEKFSNNYKMWKQCIDCIATIDVLTSLTTYALNQNQICFPEILDSANGPILEMEDGFHPCMKQDNDFIPNGITLGDESANLALLTGPNMGGKSTLMRQIGLLVIMTQIGCPIPATSCRLTLIDRIFTRLGAQDDILSGHSTFLVELSETSAILKHATRNSLVLLDELGRGTATYDGTAIAAAVVNFLADLKCRTLFSTHYHNLVDNFHDDKRVSLGHMACMVENEDNEDPTQETVTFLYKYSDGPCPKSYGFNAAKLAGMPHSIIRRAHELSKKVEATALKRKLFSKILQNAGVDEIKDLLLKIKLCTI